MSRWFARSGVCAAVAFMVALGLGTTSALATPARMMALAGDDYLEDEYGVLRWPGSLSDFGGRWWVDSGRIDAGDQSGPSAGILWKVGGPSGKYAAGFAAHARSADGDPVSLHRDFPGSSFTWMVGRALGPAQVAGSWRSAFGGASSDADAKDEFEHHRDDFALGTRFDLSPGAYLDLAGDLRRERNRVFSPEGWGNMVSYRSWGARGRAFVALGERGVFTPLFEYLREDFSGPVVGDVWQRDNAYANEGRLLRLGAAFSWLPDVDSMVALMVEHLDVTGAHAPLAIAGGGGGGGEPALVDDLAVTGARLAAERRLNWWLSLRGSLGWSHAAGINSWGDVGRDRLDMAGGAALHLGAWGCDVAAGSVDEPEPLRRLGEGIATGRVWVRATVRRNF